MLRIIGGAIVGYIALFLVAFISFTLAYLVLGADGAFRPGTYDVSTTWVAVSFVLGFVAAAVGGFVAAAIARDAKGPLILAALVIVLGLLMALPLLTAPVETRVREGSVGNFEAMQNARTPSWIALLNPFVGAIGVMVGGRLRRR